MAKTSFLIFLLCDQFQSAKYSRLFDHFSKYKTKCLLASLGHDFIIVRGRGRGRGKIVILT